MARQTQAAARRTQISIQHRVDTVNSRGEVIPAWADLHTGIWAAREPLRGRDYFAAGQMQTPADVRFTARWRPGITPLMRVMHAGQPYDIVGEPIDVDGRRVTIELMCVAGVRDGRDPATAPPPSGLDSWDDTVLWDDTLTWAEA